jgi:hypothetical protein
MGSVTVRGKKKRTFMQDGLISLNLTSMNLSDMNEIKNFDTIPMLEQLFI